MAKLGDVTRLRRRDDRDEAAPAPGGANSGVRRSPGGTTSAIAARYVGLVPILFLTDPRFVEHDTGHHHPERPARLEAVAAGVDASGLGTDLIIGGVSPASIEQVELVHPGAYLPSLRAFVDEGGTHLDPDTVVGSASFDAAMLAAGAGLEAVRRLDAGDADSAFVAVRPPGHHATPRQPMGFCLINNVAVTAMALADRGERVLIVDFDAHHGNGTQDAFYRDDRVVYASMHQYPFYPGTGAASETGQGPGAGATINVPLPMGATGDVYRRVVDELLQPLVDAWSPTWLLISAGYDAHRRDPLTDLGLTAGDYAQLTVALLALVPKGRVVLFLEGGYDLEALTDSVASTLAAAAGDAGEATHRSADERPTAGGAGHEVVDEVRVRRDRSGWS